MPNQLTVHTIGQAPIHLACAATSGFGGGDLRSTNLDSIKDLRMTAGTTPKIRVKTHVKPCGGRCDQATSEYNAPIRPKKVEIGLVTPKLRRKNAIKPNYRGMILR
jgi:hypothetical protein